MISQWHAKLPVLSCLAKKLVDISGDPRERQWLHQRLSLAVVRGNTASILACVQIWSDFSHPQCINQCSCSSLASLQWIAMAYRMSVFSVSFIVFSMFFMLCVKPLCSIVLHPFSAILTNLSLFIFHVPNTTVLLFTVKPFVICLYLCLPNPIWGCYALGRTHTQWRYSIMVCIILLCFSFLVMCGFISTSGHSIVFNEWKAGDEVGISVFQEGKQTVWVCSSK